MRHFKQGRAIEEAKLKVLSIAYHEGKFLCRRDLSLIAIYANWSSTDIGRPFREICLPMEREGLIQQFRDDDDKFVGYTITDAGRRMLLGAST